MNEATGSHPCEDWLYCERCAEIWLEDRKLREEVESL